MKETNIKPDLPENLKKILNQKERIENLPNDLNKVKDYILNRVQIINYIGVASFANLSAKSFIGSFE